MSEKLSSIGSSWDCNSANVKKWSPKVDVSEIQSRLSRKTYQKFEYKPQKAKSNYGKKKKKYLKKVENKKREKAIRIEKWRQLQKVIRDLDDKRKMKKAEK